MSPIVDLHQAVHGDVRVLLSGRKARMAEQFLNRPQIGPGIEEVRGKRVAKRVRADVMKMSTPLDVLVNHSPN